MVLTWSSTWTINVALSPGLSTVMLLETEKWILERPGNEATNCDRGGAEVTIASFSFQPQGFLEPRRDSNWSLTGLVKFSYGCQSEQKYHDG